jgi:hypothetical protein
MATIGPVGFGGGPSDPPAGRLGPVAAWRTASPKAKTWASAVAIQYPWPVGVGARPIAWTGIGNSWPRKAASPKAKTSPAAESTQ